ncbi:MAG: HipA N-terminal domain-containing protein, partial [Pseudobutyrivibrio sp.]|nr:HipA N-terminal domain-containing protein [Pseudobutyrivibrio sp.]
MSRVSKLDVCFENHIVGTMALYKDSLAAFEYSKDWLNDGFSISPFSLPLEKGVFMPKLDPFGGLYGVFADSLPDGWGRLLVDRLMRRNGLNPESMGNLDRLAIVGESGMGA